MNKNQKLVQQQFLNNEKEVIRRLRLTYGQALKDVNENIKTLEMDINGVQATIDMFDNMGGSPDDKAKLQSMLQSKIYQKQYQEAIHGQIDDVMKKLHKNAYATVDEYVNDCYSEAFIGAAFDLHGQGIPLIMPIDQESIVRAVQIDSKINKGLYFHLGESVNGLKQTIANEVSRGLVNGSSYAQIAQQIGFKMVGTYQNPGGAMAYAMRIARTEGHRIQCQAGMDACYKAKDMGADVVKQWDSTLDGDTRKSHRRVDGEIRELDEPFSNGLDFPGDPSGGAKEVINCRCALLERARWALDDDELETLKQRAEFYGLDKSENFEDFKKKYLKAADDISDVAEITDALDFQYGGFTQEQYWDWQDNYKSHNSGVHLSDEELKVIDDYTEGSFISLNAVGRYSDADLLKKGYSLDDIARIRKNADVLDGALSKFDLDTDIVTHRFERDVTWLTGNGNGVDELEKLVGKEYTAKGFTSSGMVSNRFRFTGGKSDAVHFEIVTPKGTNGAYLSMSKKGEEEFLYNRNTRFKILDGGERVIKERKYNFKTGNLDEIDVTERFLKVQVIPDADDIVKATRNKNIASAITKTKVVDDVAEEAVETATKKAVTKPSFTAAKNVDEAETYIKTYVDDSHWAGTGVSYKGISVDSANAVNKTLSDLYETYDIEPLGGVYVAKGNTKLGKAVDGATAAYSPMRKSLILNNRSMKDTKHIAEAHAEELRLVEMYKENPKSLVFKSAKAESTMKASVVSGRATVPENVTDVIHHEMGHHIESAIKQSDGYDVIKANMPKYAENISGYATINEGEYIAESFASYLKGEDLIDPALRKAFERMKK